MNQIRRGEQVHRWIWLIGMAHILVWGPCVVLDMLFCKGKMLADPPSLALIEVVSVLFVAAKARQLKKSDAQSGGRPDP